MSEILFINGKVCFLIIIDLIVWIFDDWKVDLIIYFDEIRENMFELEIYLKNILEYWDCEICDGVVFFLI